MSFAKQSRTEKARVQDILLSVLFVLVVWQVIVWVTSVPTFILPGPVKVFYAWIDNFELIAEHAGITAIEVLAGLALGTALGMITALYLMISVTAQRLLMPLLVLSQTIPVFALAPILTLWFGYGLSSKIMMTLLIIYFPVTSTFLDGLRSTPSGYLDLATTMQSSKWSTLFRIRVPAALPSLASGIRLAAVYAPIGAVIGEWVGASQGLGYLMLLANGRVKIDLMFAALITLCLFTIVLRWAIGLVCLRLNDWSGQS